IDSVNLDPAGLGIVEAAEQLHQRAFAASVRADDRNHLPHRDREMKAIESGALAARIPERHVDKLNPSPGANGSIARRAWIFHLRLEREKREQVPQKKAVGVKLPDILEQRARQPQALLESLIE